MDIASGIGSTVIIDSDFTGTPIAVRTQFGKGTGEGSIYLDNIKYSQSGTIVMNSGAAALSASGPTTVHSWAQGHIWQNGGNILASKDISSLTPARNPTLLGSDGTYFEMTRPTYVGMNQVDVTTLGLVGDGNTDNTKPLQAALNNYANKAVLFFPHGLYNIENTVNVPPGTRMVGQVCFTSHSHYSSSGLSSLPLGSPRSSSSFSGVECPSSYRPELPKRQIANSHVTNRKPRPNRYFLLSFFSFVLSFFYLFIFFLPVTSLIIIIGVAQLVDFIISTKGPVPGAKLVVWNLHDPANAHGMWV